MGGMGIHTISFQNPRLNTLPMVDSGGDVSRCSSITTGADGLPVMSYNDKTNGHLKVVECANPFCLNN